MGKDIRQQDNTLRLPLIPVLVNGVRSSHSSTFYYYSIIYYSGVVLES